MNHCPTRERGGHLTDERGRVVIDVRHPCHDPVLDVLLEEIANSKPHTWQSWIGHRERAALRGLGPGVF
jgi:hypothetical protein